MIDNHYGKGVPWGGKENQYWINGDCPLHGLKVETNIDGLEATEGTAGYTDSR